MTHKDYSKKENRLFLHFRISLFNVLIFFAFPSAYAQFSNAVFNNITLKDGLSQSSANCILQDKQGFMWFGTQDGLNKYDGYSFKIFVHDAENKNSLSNNFINTIFRQNDSLLWIGTENGLNSYNTFTNKFSRYKISILRTNYNIKSICPLNNHLLLIGCERGIIKFDTKTNKVLPIKNPLARKLSINTIIKDKHGNIWIATQNKGVYKWQNNTLKSFYQTKNQVLSLQAFADSLLLVGTNSGLEIVNIKNKKIIKPNEKLDIQAPISVLYKDKQGNIWVGTKTKGIYEYDNNLNYLQHYIHNPNINNSLSSNDILSIFQNENGIMWIGTEVGLSEFDTQKAWFEHYYHVDKNKNSLSNNLVWCILPEKDTLWVGTDNGLDAVLQSSQKVLHFKVPENKSFDEANSVYTILKDYKNRIIIGTGSGLFFLDKQKQKLESVSKLGINGFNSMIYDICEDHKHYLWVGTRNGLKIISPDTKKVYHYQLDADNKFSLPANLIRTIFQDKNGNMWLGTSNGLCRATAVSYNDIHFKTYQNNPENANTISSNTILSIFQDKKGLLWIGTFGGGINIFDLKTQKITHLTQRNGLPNNVVYGILQDNKRNIWASTNKGLARYNKQDSTFWNFTEQDGLQSNEFNINAYAKAPDGKLYFGGINGFNAFYPSQIKKNPYSPKILLTQFSLFNKPVPSHSAIIPNNITRTHKITLNYKQDVITFEFSALHYSLPKQNTYAYKLVGFDKKFINNGHLRKITYTNLDPGKYTLLVKAANSDGVWTKNPLKIKLNILPPFWQTLWFKIIIGILILIIAYIVYVARVKTIKHQKRHLEKLVNERTQKVLEQKDHIETQNKALEKEKEKVEKLLRNILPEDTIEELKVRGKARARSYRMATVMFTDFVGFTQIAEKLRPKKLVEELDNYFVKFDEIIHKYNVEKIKTIGDSYMCAGGIPIRNKSNAIEVVLAGLEIQRYIQELKETQGEDTWVLRLGIHTGDLIAGVIGIKRFAYDIWGDTVNVASRMEASGKPDKVNISGNTYDFVSDYFDCTYRGKVMAKHKGYIDMFFVNGIKPELSIDGKGIEPNKKFWDYVNLHLFSKINYRNAEKYIVTRLQNELSENLHYHSLNHTLDVCKSIERIALMEGLIGEEVFLLKTAALYHDAGFIKQYEKNEPIGAAMAREVLPDFGYTDEQIDTIVALISATSVPQMPQNHLQQIICDADLDYLGREDFHYIADKLKRELMERNKIQSDEQWDEIQVKFLSAHTYFTASAKKMRKAQKEKHIEEIKYRLANYK